MNTISQSQLDAFEKFIRVKLDINFREVAALDVVDESLQQQLSESMLSVEQLADLSVKEKMIVMLALVPHIDPEFYNNIIADYLPNGGEFAAFGGVRGVNHRGILPTGETAQYILAGNDLGKRMDVQALFSHEQHFAQRNIAALEIVREGEPGMSGRILLSQEVIDKLTTGIVSKPDFSADFPAKLISTKMEWDDLVVHPETAAHNRAYKNMAALQQ